MSDFKEYVEHRVLDAGRTSLMLPPTGTAPKEFGNGWPEYNREFADLIGVEVKTKLKMPKATMHQMNDYEEVTNWIMKLAVYARKKRMPYIARALNLRMLVHPLTEKHLFTFKKIGQVMGGHSDRSASNWYNDGLNALITLNGPEIQNSMGYSEFMDDTFDSTYHGY